MKSAISFFKKETVLSIAIILAVISSFIVLPNKDYIDYIDFRTLALLFTLMGITQGLKKLNVFDILGHKLLRTCKNVKSIIFVLWGLCFAFSMLITNDVALITFVPFSIIVFSLLGNEYKEKWLLPTVVLQTIAANLGSMLTPIGNPQNLFLYEKSSQGFASFFFLMVPYTLISLLLLIITTLVFTRKSDERTDELVLPLYEIPENPVHLISYIFLFVFCLLTVFHIIPVYIPLIVTALFLLIFDRDIFKNIDYSLLITFVGFFIFVGNMKNITAIHSFLESIIEGREILVAILSSQVISNVPAALLLSAFTDNTNALIMGTNIGGLGTLIASMASLISFKYIAKDNRDKRLPYFKLFTILNILFLAALSISILILN